MTETLSIPCQVFIDSLGFSQESHQELMQEIRGIPLMEGAVFFGPARGQAPRIIAEHALKEGSLSRLTISFGGMGEMGRWQAEYTHPTGDLRCETNDAQTMAFFLKRLPF